MATSTERNTEFREGDEFSYDLAVGAKIHKGAMVVIDAGFAKAGLTKVGVVAVGVALGTVDQAADDTKVHVRRGTYLFRNSAAGDEITRAQIGTDCFLVDDETVAKTNGGATRSKAGTIRNVEGANVWITI